MAEPEITKRRVTMTSVVFAGKDDDGVDVFHRHEAVDYVRADFLDAYIAEASKHWQRVEVADEPDAGPLGFDGPTFVPENLDVQNAGIYFPATPGSEVEAALVEAGDPAAVAAQGLGQISVPLTTLLED